MASSGGLGSKLNHEIDQKIVEEQLASVVMKLFFDHYGTVSQNINSYDRFLHSQMSEVITKEPLVLDDIMDSVRLSIIDKG